jgi:hypothetical protein
MTHHIEKNKKQAFPKYGLGKAKYWSLANWYLSVNWQMHQTTLEHNLKLIISKMDLQ